MKGEVWVESGVKWVENLVRIKGGRIYVELVGWKSAMEDYRRCYSSPWSRIFGLVPPFTFFDSGFTQQHVLLFLHSLFLSSRL